MYICYIMALIPVLIGFVLWVRSPKINIQEWLLGSAAGFILSGIFHFCAITGMTADTQTLSDKIRSGTFHPQYVERYTTTHKVGKSWVTTTHYRTHPEHWTCYDGFEVRGISKSFFDEICTNFKCPPVRTKTYKSGFYSGDPDVYETRPNTDYIYPTTGRQSYENRVQAAPSVFSYPDVSKYELYEYPKNTNWQRSDRILGPAVLIPAQEWDRMNTRLFSRLRVNVILVYFRDKDPEYATYQEAKWIGGKKNDLVLCYGGSDPLRAKWTKVFGWTEKQTVKRNLETLLLKNSIDTNLIPKIEEEINTNYQMKDWTAFDYLTVEPPLAAYMALFMVMMITQGAYYYWAYQNEFEDNAHGF